MRQRSSRRGFSASHAFTLLELLITISLIGIIAALLIPNINQARQEALRQVTRQQAKTLEKAMAAWFSNQPSLDAANVIWTNNDSSQGYINVSNFLTNELGPYLPDGGSTKFTMSGVMITTPEMKLNKADMTMSSSERFIGGATTTLNNSADSAHVMLYWDPSKRASVSPKVMLFLPNIK